MEGSWENPTSELKVKDEFTLLNAAIKIEQEWESDDYAEDGNLDNHIGNPEMLQGNLVDKEEIWNAFEIDNTVFHERVGVKIEDGTISEKIVLSKIKIETDFLEAEHFTRGNVTENEARNLELKRGEGSNEKSIICPHCFGNFKKEDDLRAHLMLLGDRPLFFCPFCPFKSPLKGSFEIHFRSHTKDRPYLCADCPVKYSRKRYLIHHVEKHTKELMCCAHCEYSTNKKTSLVSHLMVHEVDKPFKCFYCPKRFRRPSDRISHSKMYCKNLKPEKVRAPRIFTPEKVTCPVCSLKLSSKGNMVVHLKTHTNSKPFKCSKCSRAFRTKGTMQHHVVVHSKRKPFTCSLCPAKFKRITGVKSHEKIHFEEKPYGCMQCPAKFKDKSYLVRHIRMHSGQPYQCPHCAKKFSFNGSLRRHYLSSHSKQKKKTGS